MRGRWRTGLVSVILMTASLAPPVLSTFGTTAASSALTPAAAGTRAMWAWNNDPPAELIAWAGAQNVTELFVYVGDTVLTDGSLSRLQDLRARAAAAKIRLRALGGEPGWTTDHTAALAWQQTVVATGLFDGIHLDVEPYLTPGWNADLQATERAYLGLLDELRTGSRLPVEADVPFWYGQYTVGPANFADEVLKRVGAVTVMSYRDTAAGTNSMLAVSQDWLKRGAAAAKRVRLGAETDPLADCGYCTFAEEGSRRMIAVLSQVDDGARRSPAYAGVAVHRYGSWRILRP
jgi:hypothetical protein